MNDWINCKVKDFFKTHYSGEWGNLSCGDENDFNVLRSTNFGPDGKIDYSDVVVRNIPKIKQPKTVLEKGDILLEKSGGGPAQPVGRVVLFGKDSKKYVCANFIQRMCLKDEFDSKFVLYKLMQIYYLGITFKHEQQTTGIRNLKLGKYLNEECLIPPLPQQRKIARILTTIDNLIEKTEALIAKYQSIKQGLMHDLFTRGVDANGKLRPPQSEAPELYKQSELGWIPKEWEVRKIKEFCSSTSGGTPRRDIDVFWGGKIPWVKTGEIKYSVIQTTEEMITEIGLSNSSAKLIPKDTVVMALFGQGPTRGRVAILGIEACLNQACLALFPAQNCLNIFLYFTLVWGYERIRKLSNDGSQENLNSSLVGSFQMTIPSLWEQSKIATVMLKTEALALKEKILLKKHKLLKTALMQDLLTGKVQVTPDAVDMEPAHE